MSEREVDAVQVTLTFHAEPLTAPFDREDFHRFGERIMQELLILEGCNDRYTDSTTSTDARAHTVTVNLLVIGSDELEAHQQALNAVRTALHAIGAATPGWPTTEELLARPEVRLEPSAALVA